MSAATPHGQTPYYFVPAPSRHPAMIALGLFLVILGASQWVNGVGWGAWALVAGFVLWAFTLVQWFSDAIGESEGGLYSKRIDISFRWSMSWFIFSVVVLSAMAACLPEPPLSALPMAAHLRVALPARPAPRAPCP